MCNRIMNSSADVNLTEEFLNSATIQVAMDVSSKGISSYYGYCACALNKQYIVSLYS